MKCRKFAKKTLNAVGIQFHRIIHLLTLLLNFLEHPNDQIIPYNNVESNLRSDEKNGTFHIYF